MSQFKVAPAPTPTLVSVGSRLIARGVPLIVVYSARDADADSLVITPATGTRNPVISDPVKNAASGTERIETTSLKPGEYEAGLLDDDGKLLAQMVSGSRRRGPSPAFRPANDRMIAARQSACPGPTRRGTATIGSASSQTVASLASTRTSPGHTSALRSPVQPCWTARSMASTGPSEGSIFGAPAQGRRVRNPRPCRLRHTVSSGRAAEILGARTELFDDDCANGDWRGPNELEVRTRAPSSKARLPA